MRRPFAAVLAAVVCWTAAFATDPPPHPDLDTEDLRRAGPFYFRPYFLLKRFGYDSNVFLDAVDPVGDITATLSPGIQLLLRTGPRGGIRLNQEFDYVAFAEFTGENHWNSHTEIRGVYVPKRFRLILDAEYHSVQERPNLEIDDRIRQKNKVFRALIGSPLGRRVGVDLEVGHETFRFTDGDPSQELYRRRLSRDEDSVGLTASFRVLPKTDLILSGAFLDADFVYPEELRDSRAWSALIGLKFARSARIQGFFEIGPMRFRALDRDDEDYRGFVGKGELTARLGLANRLSAEFRRTIDYSTVEENLFFVARRGRLGYERFFTRRLSFEVAIGDGVNEYPNEMPLREPEPRIGFRNDRIREYEAIVYYRFREGLSLDVGLSHLEIDSTDDSIDRRQNIVGVGTTVLF